MGKYFSVPELTHSDTAQAQNINNTPTSKEELKLEALIVNLDAIRAKWGHPINISSGFRSKELNVAISGSKTSQHMKAEAVDMICPDLWSLFLLIEDQFQYTQLIYEESGSKKWIHLGIDPGNLKNQTMTYDNGVYKTYKA